MKNAAAIHEGFMNGSRIILPRVGGGGGGRGGWGNVCHPSTESHQGATHPRAVGSQQATTRAAQMDEEMFGGGL